MGLGGVMGWGASMGLGGFIGLGVPIGLGMSLWGWVYWGPHHPIECEPDRG